MDHIPDLDTGFDVFKDFVCKQMVRDSQQLLVDNQRKDTEIRTLIHRLKQMELHLTKSDQRIAELTRSVVKLTNFKTSVLKSLEGEDRHTEWNSIPFEARRESQYFSPGSSPYRTSQLPTSLYASNYDSSFIDSSTFINPNHYSPQFSVGSSPGENSSIPDSIRVNPPGSVRPPFTGRPNSEPGTTDTLTRDPWTSQRPQSERKADMDEKQKGKSPLNQRDTDRQTSSSGSKSKKAPSIDGRTFFQKARTALSYDKFTALLWQVKCYNNREQTRSQTVKLVKEILTEEHSDLMKDFETLLQAR